MLIVADFFEDMRRRTETNVVGRVETMIRVLIDNQDEIMKTGEGNMSLRFDCSGKAVNARIEKRLGSPPQ